MKYVFLILIPVMIMGCRGEKAQADLSAQEIVDRAIEVAGGDRYRESAIQFAFRDRDYVSFRENGKRVLRRITTTDTAVITDSKIGNAFQRLVNDTLQILPDTTSNRLANSVNSVHYFAYLPYGLNDRAVNKELLGRVKLEDSMYYKIRVTFDQEGGGEDFEDVFIYWFHTETFRPDYLAYEYHTDGGGQRFRVAYNDRSVGGIRFQDYRNYKPLVAAPIAAIDSLYTAGKLELLSVIELEDVRVDPDTF
ncbi:DUF6503 family protein [Robiginitalea biformata]|uniref:Deoxyribose-phosphate aldolase n=1 Tax=Robiginitalea biformata (strain ATCC BAA-864 / DSM 15991 / KCTC 12146 / HTCC2501) TaxID=313596 RepID=A4CLT1_ROBBH|nr:DUF6503 family protein [Robiginitalea biformata]EAR15830.1 hypothetical protein RB2501_15919 [Robiginitalea biformata HTCC2501]